MKTPHDENAERAQRDRDLVMSSFTSSAARNDLIGRMRCIPRILAAKNLAMGRPLGDSDLEDLAQETMIKVWSKRSEFEGRSSLETWIYPFCYHNLMNRVRKVARRPRTMGSEGMDAVDPRGPAPDHSDVHSALAALERDDARLVRMKHFEDLSFTQIGERLCVSPNTIKARYYKALTHLKRLLADEQPDVS